MLLSIIIILYAYILYFICFVYSMMIYFIV